MSYKCYKCKITFHWLEDHDDHQKDCQGPYNIYGELALIEQPKDKNEALKIIQGWATDEHIGIKTMEHITDLLIQNEALKEDAKELIDEINKLIDHQGKKKSHLFRVIQEQHRTISSAIMEKNKAIRNLQGNQT